MLITDLLGAAIYATGIPEAPIRWLDMRYVDLDGYWQPETTDERNPAAYWRVGIVADDMPNGTVSRSLASVLIQFGTENTEGDWLANVREAQAYIIRVIEQLKPYITGTVTHGVVRLMGTSQACGYQARLTLVYNPAGCC